MPKNNQQLIASYQDFEDEAIVAISPQSTGVRLSAIPTGTSFTAPLGTQVLLPPAVVSLGSDQPSDGDVYEIVDTDGSCTPLSPIIVTPPVGTSIADGPENTGTNALAASLILSFPFVTARLTYDAGTETIARNRFGLDVSEPSANANLVVAGTASGQVAPTGAGGGGGLTPPIAPGAILWATGGLIPSVSGTYKVDMSFTCEDSAADNLVLTLAAYGDWTATTGGSGGVGATNMSYETTAGTVPVVTAGVGPTVLATAEQSVPVGKLVTISLSALVPCPVVLNPVPPGFEPVAIACFLSSSAGGTLTLNKLSVSVVEVPIL